MVHFVSDLVPGREMLITKLGKHVSVPYLKMLNTVINYMVNGLIVNPQGYKDVVCSLKKTLKSPPLAPSILYYPNNSTKNKQNNQTDIIFDGGGIECLHIFPTTTTTTNNNKQQQPF